MNVTPPLVASTMSSINRAPSPPSHEIVSSIPPALSLWYAPSPLVVTTAPSRLAAAAYTAPTFDASANDSRIATRGDAATVRADRSTRRADPPYARINPPAPSLIPPKYRTTTQSTSDSPSLLIAPSIGAPAVPVGSPPSEDLSVDPVPDETYPKHTCRLLGWSSRTLSMTARASSHDEHRAAYPTKRDFLTTSSATYKSVPSKVLRRGGDPDDDDNEEEEDDDHNLDLTPESVAGGRPDVDSLLSVADDDDDDGWRKRKAAGGRRWWW